MAQSTGSAAPETALQKLAKRAFTVSLLAPSAAGSAPLHSRHLKRIHLAPEILKAVKICAGDALVLRKMPAQQSAEAIEDEMKKLQLGEVRFASSPSVAELDADVVRRDRAPVKPARSRHLRLPLPSASPGRISPCRDHVRFPSARVLRASLN